MKKTPELKLIPLKLKKSGEIIGQIPTGDGKIPEKRGRGRPRKSENPENPKKGFSEKLEELKKADSKIKSLGRKLGAIEKSVGLKSPKPKKEKNPERQKIGSLARRKGHGFEREVANLLKPIFPDARRHLEYQDAEANGVDLVNTGHFRIQCKRGRLYAPESAINQVSFDELMGEVPVLISQADRSPAIVTMPLSEYARLSEKAHETLMVSISMSEFLGLLKKTESKKKKSG